MALVYKIRSGQPPLLEAAMYNTLRAGARFSDIPPLFQSPLTQFHVHTNLCFRGHIPIPCSMSSRAH
jgi:hypothetical protein